MASFTVDVQSLYGPFNMSGFCDVKHKKINNKSCQNLFYRYFKMASYKFKV